MFWRNSYVISWFNRYVTWVRRQRRDMLVFESRCHLSTTHGGGFTLHLFNAERYARKLWVPIFIVFGLMRLGIEPNSTVSIADAVPNYTSLNGKTSPEKKSVNEDSADSATKHQYSFLAFIISKQLVFGHLVSQITCYKNWSFEIHQKTGNFFFNACNR